MMQENDSHKYVTVTELKAILRMCERDFKPEENPIVHTTSMELVTHCPENDSIVNIRGERESMSEVTFCLEGSDDEDTCRMLAVKMTVE